MIKSLIKILCIACITLILGCVCYGMPDDVIGTPYDDAVETLSALKIIQINEDNLFKPNDLITRAEFTVAIARMLGIANDKESMKTDTPFSDVDASYWASGEINAMVNYKNGIIKGYEDGRFIPEASITYDQAVKMLVCALGYESYAEQKGGYPLGFMEVAKEIGIINNSDKAAGLATRRGEAAQLLYNCLEVDIMVQTRFGEETKYSITKGENVLKKYFNVYKKKGILKGTYETTLIGESSLSEDEVEIDNTTYKIGDTNAKDYLGYEVTIYAKEDIEKSMDVLLHVKPERKNRVITINADDITDATISNIKYTVNDGDSGKIRELSVSPVANLIYNGKAYPNYDESEFKPNSGKVVLLDRDDDGVYDVIFVTEYQTLVVESVSVNAQVIYGKNVYGNHAFIDVNTDNNDNIIIIKKDGKDISLSDIKKWDVLSIEESKNDGEKLIKINVTSQKVKGIVEEKVDGDDYIIIEGKKYYVESSIISKIKVGDEATYCLNIEGKVVAVDYYKLFSDEVYGYLTKMAPSVGLSGKIQFEVFTSDGELKVFHGADKITIDGERKDSSKIDNISKQLIRYKTNSNGEICEINTAKDLSASNEEDKKSAIERNEFRKSSVINDKKFRKNNTSFDSKVFIDSSTLVFIVPQTPDAEGEKTDESKYAVLTSSYLIYDKAYSFESYDESEYNLAKVILIREKPVIQKSSFNTTPLFLVEKVVSAIDEQGQTVQKVYGFYGKQYVNYYTTSVSEETTEDDSQKDAENGSDIWKAKPGDVLQIYVNAKGKVAKFAFRYRISDGNALINNPDDFHVEAEFYAGVIDSISKSEKKMKVRDSESNTCFDLSYSSLSVCIFDDKVREKKCMSGTIDDLEQGDYVVMHIRYSTVQEIVSIRFE